MLWRNSLTENFTAFSEFINPLNGYHSSLAQRYGDNSFKSFKRFMRWFYDVNRESLTSFEFEGKDWFAEHIVSMIRDGSLNAADMWLVPFIYVNTYDERVYFPKYVRSGSSIYPGRDTWWRRGGTYEDFKAKFTQIINKANQENLDSYSATGVLGDLSMHNEEAVSCIRMLLNVDHTYASDDGYSWSASECVDRLRRDGMRFQFSRTNEYGSVRYVAVDDATANVPASFTNLLRQFEYSTDVTSLIPNKLKAKNEHDVPLYGVELEVKSDHKISEIVTAFPEPFLICKKDSSISGNKRHAYEMVTVPASLRIQRRMWASLFSKLGYDKFDTSKDTNNGMHVHVGREAFFGDLHVIKFSWFFNAPANRWFIMETAERSEREYSQYCEFTDFSAFKTEHKAFANVAKVSTGKMRVVNHSKPHTIEVRVFKGIVNFAAVVRNLELVDAVLQYTREASIKECTIDCMIDWLNKLPRSRYKVLRQWINMLEESTVRGNAAVTKKLFNITSKDGILKAVNNSGIHITDKLCDTLNATMFGKFRFFARDGKLTTELVKVTPITSIDTDLLRSYSR